MKKCVLRLTVAAAAAVLTVIMLMAFMKTDSFANTYDLDGLLREGVTTTVTFNTTTYDSNATVYYGFKATKTGYITFTADYSGYTVLCNSSKTTVSKGTSTSGDYLSGTSSYAYQRSISYGVKKGKTYYIKMTGFPSTRNSAGKYVATVKWNGKAVKASKYGKTKGKAKTIKRKKTVKGLFVAGNRKAQWFKITNKQKKTKITIKSTKNNDSFKIITRYKSFGHWYNYTSHVYRSNSPDVITGTVSRKVKHTYYIKIVPEGKTSGYYTIKWK